MPLSTLRIPHYDSSKYFPIIGKNFLCLQEKNISEVVFCFIFCEVFFVLR